MLGYIIITIYLHMLIFHSMLLCFTPMLTVYYIAILRNTIDYKTSYFLCYKATRKLSKIEFNTSKIKTS